MGKEGEGILVYYCIPQRDRVADVHAWPQGDLRERRDQLRHGNRLSGATLVDSKHEVCVGVLIFNQRNKFRTMVKIRFGRSLSEPLGLRSLIPNSQTIRTIAWAADIRQDRTLPENGTAANRG
jgi:hypothetical protein